MTKILIGVGALLVAAVGFLVLANQSLPGDMLYPVKIGFNERVGSILAGSGRSQIDWHINATDRRIREASEASLAGRFNAGGEKLVFDDFNNHMKAIELYITEALAEGRREEAKDVAVKLGKVLASQAESLIFAQTTAKADTENVEGQDALDFLVLRVTGALTASAAIAAGTGVEDPQPEGVGDGSNTDEWGNPIE